MSLILVLIVHTDEISRLMRLLVVHNNTNSEKKVLYSFLFFFTSGFKGQFSKSKIKKLIIFNNIYATNMYILFYFRFNESLGPCCK